MKYIYSVLAVSLVLITGCDKPKKESRILRPRKIVVSTNTTVGSVSLKLERLYTPEPLIAGKSPFLLSGLETFDDQLLISTGEGALLAFMLPTTNDTNLSINTEFGTNGMFQIPDSEKTWPSGRANNKTKVAYIGKGKLTVNGNILISDNAAQKMELPTSVSSDGSWGVSRPQPHRTGRSVHLWSADSDGYQKKLFMSNKEEPTAKLRIDGCEIIDDNIVLVGTISDEDHRLFCIDINKNTIWETNIGALRSGRISDIEQTENGIIILNGNLAMLSYFTREGDLVGHLKLVNYMGSPSSGIEPKVLDLGLFMPRFTDMAYNPSDGCLYILGSADIPGDRKTEHIGFIYRVQGL